ncbi:RNA polymerase sigma factor FliA [Marinospirillum alkaliphilum]|uniref:RNA polymerase sigma factor FliA n=1 Tax=Marinospirillum alkaliphilum DSM 21637 TaxID=1122209 RepID=A0A1K1VBG6_9GAMM|nr:RNA polymerase sigma factor FliA [Marinospirillum alkaliphilum]SFX22489.1 RNA polymerase, sigma 28 subunit, SigD/FliA/WhiG [Marinospirillum alkaliphilum DSM 21637]
MTAAKGLNLYSRNQQLADSRLLEQYAALVRRIAHHLLARLPSTVQLDDLLQSGSMGLIEASRNFDAEKGASFETFASIRIRGAMLDEVRRQDWVPRSVHRNSRRVSEAVRNIEARTGRDAQDHEIAQEMGVSLDEYNQYLADTAGSRLFSIEELSGQEDSSFEVADDNGSEPLAEVQESRFQESLAKAISALPEREQMVLSLYYNEELNLKEIGAILSVSESRISQILSQAAARLRGRLADWKNV